MNSIHEYYDSMADISVTTREAIESLELARKNVQEALRTINGFKKHGDMTISFVSNVTTNDVHRNLLFLELLLNQTFGVTNTLTFQELLELTSYELKEEDFQQW
ncbi:hypothetical protein [Microcoleus asticus]|uniref:Uncharacterized protein n=1 Tax=Microcoleus asticus IPMA8 TaxID=2563858 RepID=A0ABX2CXS6_9CYAN|nr:hypothetical protein [Microcoleus asticus]NQE35216.1 hypothetical protein [Microcoleus asticus IPMA8]